MKLGEIIKARRAESGMSLQDVADAAGMTKGYLHEIESGKTFNLGLIIAIRLSVCLGIPVNMMAAAALESLTASEGEK